MDIKSSLLNSKEFSLVKDSLIKVSEIDHKEKFRVNMLEYINDSADNDDDEFFFDMLEFVRFLNPNNDSVAYTTPDHLIYLNAPNGGGIGEKVRIWDFVYDHECLHQLWDTFGVGDKLKADGIEYNHYILNVASDCVINDYLSYYRKKEQPEDGITPEYLEKNYGVIYDRKKDTQYTLYLKLLEHKDELNKDERCQDQCGDEGQQGEGNSKEGNASGKGSSKQGSGAGSQGNGKGKSGNNSDEEEAQDAAKKAQNDADKAKDAAEDDENNKDAANDAQAAADKAKEEADKAKEAAEKGDKEGAKKHADAAKKAAKEAKKAAEKAGVKNEDKDNNGDKGNENANSEGSSGQGSGTADREESDVDLEKIRKDAEAIINKYKEKLSGDLGTFINQCKASQSLKESGLITGAQKGISAWNKQLQQYTSAYVKNKVFKKQREFKRTYQKVKRGSGFVEYGQPIQRGKKIKDDKLLINVAFYIDRSGSMGGCINEVFNASYIIANSLQKQFGKEKVVDKVSFKMFAFDDRMEEVDWGKKVNARGGTMDFDEILKFINEKTNSYLINVIITDAEFNINENEIEKFLKDINGCVIFVTNNQTSDVKKIASKTQNKMKLFYVQADNDFTISK